MKRAQLNRFERAIVPASVLQPTPGPTDGSAALYALFSMMTCDERDEVRAVLETRPLPDDWREQVGQIVGRALAG